MSLVVVVIGGGIVGLATAYTLTSKLPGHRIVVIEKESELLLHQSGHNSGVMHTGIYYAPGSLKAKNCSQGKRMLEEFCKERGVPFEICGKLIIATEEWELPALQKVYERGVANGVSCELVGPERMREIEPAVQGIRGIHVPHAGIINYVAVGQAYADIIRERGGEIRLNSGLLSAQRQGSMWTLETASGVISANLVINCAGLHSDKVAALMGSEPSARIVPFRGEYYELRPEAQHLCRNLIYPVPDPEYPFLGVHFTRMIGGGVECGPNAVLALAREGYRHTSINPGELAEMLSYGGFWRFAVKHWKTGLSEFRRSLSPVLFAASLQRLVPAITVQDLIPASAGVRAQALQATGKLVDDFLILEAPGVVHVLNAPSPAATSSLSIGLTICEYVQRQVAPG
jgi:L-2-hydroxyglutarate oxidase